MSALADFQDAFAAALLAPESADASVRALVGQPGFAVYRNTVAKGCIDALEANFPAVARLVGEEWFRAAAAVFARGRLPDAPMLALYGDAFPDFLAAFEPARELPYLAAVARIDRLRSEAHAAADAAPLDPAALARRSPAALAGCRLVPHPAARWAWFEDTPAPTIWAREHAPGGDRTEIAWRSEGILLTRPRDAVGHGFVGKAGCAFLDACAAGARIDEAAADALAAEPDADLSALMAQFLAAGAFTLLIQENRP